MRIISAISGDARISAKALAKKLSIHPNTLLQRLKRLEQKGVIKGYHTNLDYDLIGYDIHVVVMMKVRGGRPGDVKQLDEFLEMKELESLYATTGSWDVMSFWRVRDKDHLNEVLKKITNHKNVSRTMSHIVLYTYRGPELFNPFSPDEAKHS